MNFIKILAISLFTALLALADNGAVLTCQVPNAEAPATIMLNIAVEGDVSADFVTLQLVDGQNSALFFTQSAKGETEKNLAEGNLAFLVLTEQTKGESGAIRNAGFFAVSKRGEAFSGFLAANGHVYPLVCK